MFAMLLFLGQLVKNHGVICILTNTGKIRQPISRRGFLGGLTASFAFSPSLSLSAQGEGTFELRAQKASRRIGGHNFPASPLWLYDGTSPGPEIRVRKGEMVHIRFINELDEPTSIHWHGIRIENSMDGVSGLTQDPVLPGETFEYRFTVPDAGTFWYHAHTSSMEQVARGLYGALIVEEDPNVSERIQDIVLILDDWWLDQNGDFQDGFEDYLVGKQGGRIGNVFTVNGRPPGEAVQVDARRIYRLRLINAANARVFSLRLNASIQALTSLDGFNLRRQVAQNDTFRLGPGQRADFLVSPTIGEPVTLIDEDGMLSGPSDDGKPLQLVSLVPVGSKGFATTVLPPLQMPALSDPDPESAVSVSLIMEGGSPSVLQSVTYGGRQLDQNELATVQQVWAFNGIANMPEQPLFRAERGTHVLIDIENRTEWTHAMHLHGHHFKVGTSTTSIAASPWRDTILMDRHERANITFIADNPGNWLLHCHMLQHATAGMNTWFRIA